MAKQIHNTPIRFPDILLPKQHIDLQKWSVIACDQFTSNKEYWKNVETLVGDAPSTLATIIPEIYFENEDVYYKKLSTLKDTSEKYLDEVFDVHPDSMLIINRSSSRVSSRKGIVVQLDLNEYDPNPSGNNVVKTTEAVIESRLPKRIETKKASILDISHVLMIYEDQAHTLISQLEQTITNLAFETPLMMDGGNATANFCDTEKAAHIISEFFEKKSNQSSDKVVLAVGDGNHSLMSAKRIWEENGSDMNSPERWALVELVNIYDEGLQIEPIHRVLFNANIPEVKKQLENLGAFSSAPISQDSLQIIQGSAPIQYWTQNATDRIPVEVIEDMLQNNRSLYTELDFIHDEAEVMEISQRNEMNLGIIFPHFDRDSIFKVVRSKKFFPRKSFSLGEGKDKKYYIEACSRRA